MGGREPLVIPNLIEHELTKDMDVTQAFGGGSLIGAPIFLKNGKKFGTLCGMDNVPYDFSEKDIKLFKSLATLLTYVIDLDDSYQQILKLSAPIVPLLQGIAILPLIGEIDEERGEKISTMIIKEAHKLQLNHLIIDLSGISEVEKEFFYLLNLVEVLKLLGIEALFTGMRPDLARKAIKEDNHSLNEVSFFGNLQQALSYVGIKLTV